MWCVDLGAQTARPYNRRMEGPNVKITKSGRRRIPEGGWQAFIKAVEKKAKERARRKSVPKPDASNLRPGRSALWEKAPRCQATARYKGGAPCRNAAISGASRCRVHGGLLEVPSHKANTTGLEPGGYLTKLLAHASAREQFHAYPKPTRQTVLQAYQAAAHTAKRGSRPWNTLLEGAHAIAQHDNGRAFRRWLALVKERHGHKGAVPWK